VASSGKFIPIRQLVKEFIFMKRDISDTKAQYKFGNSDYGKEV
jgi:hypothetical protein